MPKQANDIRLNHLILRKRLDQNPTGLSREEFETPSDFEPGLVPEQFQDRKKGLQIYKSLCNLNDALEFADQDNDGIKMKVNTKYFGGEFPFDIGYVLISKYDDRKFLVTKVDCQNEWLWLGVWED